MVFDHVIYPGKIIGGTEKTVEIEKSKNRFKEGPGPDKIRNRVILAALNKRPDLYAICDFDGDMPAGSQVFRCIANTKTYTSPKTWKITLSPYLPIGYAGKNSRISSVIEQYYVLFKVNMTEITLRKNEIFLLPFK